MDGVQVLMERMVAVIIILQVKERYLGSSDLCNAVLQPVQPVINIIQLKVDVVAGTGSLLLLHPPEYCNVVDIVL